MGNHYHSNDQLRISRIILLCLMLLVSFIPTTFAQDSNEEDAYDIILEVKHGRKTLSAAMFGLQKNEKYYIPIQELARIVKFNAKVSLDDETVSGFFFSEKNNYRLNVKEGTFTRRDKSYDFDKEDAFVFSQEFGIGDIYVTPDLLNKIWPLDLSLDPLIQVLKIQTTRDLPYQLSSIRQRNRNNRLNQNNSLDNNFDLPRIDNHYKSFSLPAIDFTSTTGIGGLQDGFSQVLNIRGRNDFLKTQASYNFGFGKEPGDSAKFESARLLFERKSYEKGDNPLGLQLLQFGDVRPKPSNLIDGSLFGRGLLLSTEPQKQIRNFDQITIEGTAEPGWEVELYKGNELIAFQDVDSQGEYRFENVELNFNNTTIRTILYGPEGQVRETEKKYNISSSMLQPNKTIFEASALDTNKNLIHTNNRPRNAPEGIGQNYKLKRGINSWLSSFVTFTSMPTRQDDRNYATLGVNLSLLGASGLAEVYQDLSGGTAFDLRAAGSYFGTNVNVRNSILSNFESEQVGFDENARTSRTELSLSRPFSTSLGSFGLRFRTDHERFEGLDDRTEFDLSQTYAKNGFRITHGNTTDLVDKSHRRTDGRVNTTFRINSNWQTRSLLNYDVFPELDLRNTRSEIRYRDNKKLTSSFSVDRNFQNKNIKLGSQLSYDFDKFRTGLNVDWDKDSGFRSFLRTSFSVAPYDKDNNYIMSSKNLSSRAALNANVFLDNDYDGVFGSGDEAIEDAKVKIGRRETDLSDSDGDATYLGSPKNEYENIILNTDSLENPFSISSEAGYRSLLRPGTAVSVDFPVVNTGIVDGTVTTHTGALAGVRMELLKDGQIIDTTSTAFDGFYTFEYVEPAAYTIRIDPSYEQVNIPPKEILVTSETLFQSGIDFQIFKQADEVACAKNSDGRITQNCLNKLAQDGMQQPASLFQTNTNIPVVNKIRIAERPTYLRMVLDYDRPPSPYQVMQATDNQKITVILSNTNWNVQQSWASNESQFLKEFSAQRLQNGEIKMTLQPVNTARVKFSEILEPNHSGGYRIYFDIAKK